MAHSPPPTTLLLPPCLSPSPSSSMLAMMPAMPSRARGHAGEACMKCKLSLSLARCRGGAAGVIIVPLCCRPRQGHRSRVVLGPIGKANERGPGPLRVRCRLPCWPRQSETLMTECTLAPSERIDKHSVGRAEDGGVRNPWSPVSPREEHN